MLATYLVGIAEESIASTTWLIGNLHLREKFGGGGNIRPEETMSTTEDNNRA
jgi:hypothetical protein